MKRFILLLTVMVSVCSASAQRDSMFDDAYRFVFYAVLEGCFDDGLTTGDAAQILLKGEGQGYSHFIYACPICTPALHALEVYRSRPAHFFGLKSGASTFGGGLSGEVQKQLYSKKPEDRLTAINTLVQGWTAKRMKLLRLTDQERADLQKVLEKRREEGMKSLKQAEREPERFNASAFAEVKQCAFCNAACGMSLKPAGRK